MLKKILVLLLLASFPIISSEQDDSVEISDEDLAYLESAMPDEIENGSESEITRGRKNCKKNRLRKICNLLVKACARVGALRVAGNATVGGSLAVNGPITGNPVMIAAPVTIAGPVAVTNPLSIGNCKLECSSTGLVVTTPSGSTTIAGPATIANPLVIGDCTLTCTPAGLVVASPAGTTTIGGPATIANPLVIGECSLTCTDAGLEVTSPAGTIVLTGASAASAGYAYIYNTDPAVIAKEAAINFSSNGPLVGITHAPGTDAINITNAGVYAVTFSVSGVEPNQFAIFVNGAPATDTVYGSGAGTQQNTGQAILTLSTGDVITLVNHTSTAGVTLQTLAGGAVVNVNASVLIQRLA